jgi:hypothetical protein
MAPFLRELQPLDAIGWVHPEIPTETDPYHQRYPDVDLAALLGNQHLTTEQKSKVIFGFYTKQV